MSEKRYYVNGALYLCDNDLSNTLSIFECADLLNQLTEENEQLKEQLQMIERIIQTQITEKEEDLRTSVKGGMPTGGLYSEIEILEKLKKECFR